MRFIQVSCLGASPSSESRYLRAKAAAEGAVLSALPEVGILIPISCHVYFRSISFDNLLSSIGHRYETCCDDWYRGSNFESMGFCFKKIWLSSTCRGWVYQVCFTYINYKF